MLVFTRTKHGADKVVRGLQKAGFAAEAIHGNKSQNQRERVLADFRNGKLRTLVATDIAARGIDVDGVSHVVNYDLPNIPESYVHRIGRTARAGADGIAISFCDHEERAFLRDIEQLIRITIPSTDRRTGERPAAAPARSPPWPPHRRTAAPRRPQQRGNGGGHHGGGQAATQPAPEAAAWPASRPSAGRTAAPPWAANGRDARQCSVPGEPHRRLGKCHIPARPGEPSPATPADRRFG